MSLRWRPAVSSDIEYCLSILVNRTGGGLVGEATALRIWKQLTEEPFFLSAVVEFDATPGRRFPAFGAAIFASPDFVQRELDCPSQDINSRVIAGLAMGRRVLASRLEVARGNAALGLDVVIIGGMWRDACMLPEERREIQILLVRSFVESLAGYRVRRIIQETADPATDEYLRRSPEFQAVAKFPQGGRTLYVMTAESVKPFAGSFGNAIFSYREPNLHLLPSHQELLVSSLTGATDMELAALLKLSPDAVKARWRSVYQHLTHSRPDLLAGTASAGRGLQKRHLVIEYVRRHPEELRPYDWSFRSGTALRRAAFH
jgi:hypothetical protein